LKENGLKEISKINGFRLEFPPFITKIGNRKIAILHEPDDIQDLIKENPSIDLILHGHTHRYRNEKMNGIQIFNPGECAGLQKGRNAIGLVNLKNLSFERIFF
jgi:predicted phosphodiesterase